MTWEIAVGLFTILSAFCGVMSVVVKVNKTLTTLDISVNRLNESMKEQSAKTEKIFTRLEQYDRRLGALERAEPRPSTPSHPSRPSHPPRRRPTVSVWPEPQSYGKEVSGYEEN